MRLIVCDTGPLIHLREAGSLDILQAAGRIVVPPSVQAELINHDLFWDEQWPGWIEAQALDAAARLIAKAQGLEVHGSLGVLLWAAATGRFRRSEAESLLEALFRSSLWLSPQLREEARSALHHIFL